MNTNTVTETETTETETPYLFLENSFDPTAYGQGSEIIVAKKAWFADTPYCQLRNRWGQLAENDMDGEHNGEDCCDTVMAHEYWDGSNHQTIEYGSEDAAYSEVTDETEIAKYADLVEKALHDNRYPFEDAGTGYTACEIDGYKITESIWQGAWEIYTISKIQSDEDFQ
jgi:hypothetical protein